MNSEFLNLKLNGPIGFLRMAKKRGMLKVVRKRTEVARKKA